MAEAMTRTTERIGESKEIFRLGGAMRVNIDGVDSAVLLSDESEKLPEEHGGATVRKVEVIPWALWEKARVLFENYREFDGNEDSNSAEGFLERLREWIGSRISAMALFTALSAAACDTTNHDDPTEQSSKWTQRQSALTSQLKYSYGDKIIPPWTTFGDDSLQLGKVGEKKVIIFTRLWNVEDSAPYGDDRAYFYVDCDTFEKCLTVQKAKQLQVPTLPHSQAAPPAIVGNDFYFQGLVDPKEHKGTLGYTPYLNKSGQVEMVLNVDNITVNDSKILASYNSVVYEVVDGVETPFLYTSNGGGPKVAKQNLLTMEITFPNYPHSACDLPHRPGTADGPGKWLASVPINSPNTVCWLVEADTFGAIKPGVEYFLDKVNKSTGGKNTYHPRIGEPDPVTGAEVVWFLKGNDDSTARIMAMVRTPILVNPEPNPEPSTEPDTTDAGGTAETDTTAVELPQNPEPDAEIATETETTADAIDVVLDGATDDGNTTETSDETGNGSTDIATDEATPPDNGAQELPPLKTTDPTQKKPQTNALKSQAR